MLSYFGHIARSDGDSLEKVIMQGQVEGNRKPGRPRTRWIDQIKSLAGSSSLFKIFILLQRRVRDCMSLLTSRAISHDVIKPTTQKTMLVPDHFPKLPLLLISIGIYYLIEFFVLILEKTNIVNLTTKSTKTLWYTCCKCTGGPDTIA